MRASVFFAVNFVLTFVIVTPNIWLEINGQDVIGIILFASHDIYSIITSYIIIHLSFFARYSFVMTRFRVRYIHFYNLR